ncbi:HugZ family protein [Acuticoccus sp.]|uniref:HugZ family pyridoxamine 5'-phosphate oxidase n=1 Tax=Acuticoccus sp. TaxID=1904378 RepID=UPI003B526F61
MKFDRRTAAPLARTLVRAASEAALGTLEPSGHPNASHVAAATLPTGAPLLLVSTLALHTKNLQRDARASMLFSGSAVSADPNTRPRVTLIGSMSPVAEVEVARQRFLRRHPHAALYADFADFSFFHLAPERVHLVAGFGRIIDLAPDEVLAPADAAAALSAIDGEACAHMNEDHADALALIAERLVGGPPGDWRAVGIDPQGIDLTDGTCIVRAEFDDGPVADAGHLRRALKKLADRARAAH